MLDSSRWHEPFGEHLSRWEFRSSDLISEFTFFNLVIRLSKVKQSFNFQLFTHRSSVFFELRAAVPGLTLFEETA